MRACCILTCPLIIKNNQNGRQIHVLSLKDLGSFLTIKDVGEYVYSYKNHRKKIYLVYFAILYSNTANHKNVCTKWSTPLARFCVKIIFLLLFIVLIWQPNNTCCDIVCFCNVYIYVILRAIYKTCQVENLKKSMQYNKRHGHKKLWYSYLHGNQCCLSGFRLHAVRCRWDNGGLG